MDISVRSIGSDDRDKWFENLNEIDFEDLYKSIKNGPMNEKGKHRLTEETNASIGALKIQIFSNEHPFFHKISPLKKSYRVNNVVIFRI